VSPVPVVAGVDEVGRGPLAGPVVAAAVVLRRPVPGLADSKLLRPARREALQALLREAAVIGIGCVSAALIDRTDIHRATLLAMRRAVLRLGLRPDRVLVDGRFCPVLDELGPDLDLRAVIGGDRSEPAIAAASIVAKVLRDGLMRRVDRRHPGYGFARNAGYGTAEHLLALARLGPTSHHRRSFRPVAAVFLPGNQGGATSPAAQGSSARTWSR
jgi:ribonuclease HII